MQVSVLVALFILSSENHVNEGRSWIISNFHYTAILHFVWKGTGNFHFAVAFVTLLLIDTSIVLTVCWRRPPVLCYWCYWYCRHQCCFAAINKFTKAVAGKSWKMLVFIKRESWIELAIYSCIWARRLQSWCQS